MKIPAVVGAASAAMAVAITAPVAGDRVTPPAVLEN
jgi:hypothetical protein